MEWTIKRDGIDERLMVAATGDCDLYDAPRFARAVLDELRPGVRRIGVDLSGVAYLDSTGVGALIRILQEARRIGAELRFRGVAGSPRRVLAMSGILGVMVEAEDPR
jgi:anti-sigma B factor antagonist